MHENKGDLPTISSKREGDLPFSLFQYLSNYLEDILNLALSGRASFGQHQKLGARLKYCEYKRQQRQR